MKSRTLVMITAAIITTAAIILTAGLSLLHGSAFNQATADEIPIPTLDEAITDTATSATTDEVLDVVQPSAPEEETPATEEEPEEEKPLVKPADINMKNDVFIQIYEHETGKLVGQLEFTDDEVYKTIEENHLKIYGFYDCNFAECIYDPQGDNGFSDEPICLPYGKYRIEIFAIWCADNNGVGCLPFAYTYGDTDIVEMFPDGMLYSGCEEFISYVDSLIADEIAAIEAGTVEAPTREEDITYIVGYGKYWNGTSFNWTGDFHGRYQRGTPRFPYLIED